LHRAWADECWSADVADRFPKIQHHGAFYLLIGASVSCSHGALRRGALDLRHCLWFSMGADYMLIPLVTAEMLWAPLRLDSF